MLSRIEGIGERVMLCLPFFGRERRLFLAADLARGCAAFLRQGETLESALEWNRRACRSEWPPA